MYPPAKGTPLLDGANDPQQAVYQSSKKNTAVRHGSELFAYLTRVGNPLFPSQN
jgi:hypothetical protein